MRTSLVTALVECAGCSQKYGIRRFLLGLSCDELQFLAEFLGCCVLESGKECSGSKAELAAAIAQYQRARAGSSHGTCLSDREHKMVLLEEFLCRTGVLHRPLAVTGQA